MKKFIILTLFTVLSSLSLKAFLTEDEQARLIEKHRAPIEITQELDVLFENETARNIFLSRENKACLTSHTDDRSLRSGNIDQIYGLTLEEFDAQDNFSKKFWRESEDVKKDIKELEIKYNFKTNLRWPTKLAIQFNDMPEYLVKMSCGIWPSKYQNISRVLTNEVIQTIDSEYLYTIDKYLYHIPGTSDELNDENYIVISTYIKNLPTIRENQINFLSLNPKNADDFDIISTLRRLIVECNLWQIDPKNVVLLNDQLLFIDTQLDGISGSMFEYIYSDESFYLKSDERKRRLQNCGLGGLKNLLSKRAVEYLNENYEDFFLI